MVSFIAILFPFRLKWATMDWRRRVVPIAIHPQHDFAAEGVRLVRSNRVRQWELRADNRANLTGVNSSSDFLQLGSPRLDDEERFAGALVLRILLGRGDRHEPAARLQHAPRPPQGVA